MTPTDETAEILAIQALTYIAQRPEQIERFLALTGIGPDALRAQAADPAFLAGVLDFLLGHEATLMDFAAVAGVDPHAVPAARRRLPGAPAAGW